MPISRTNHLPDFFSSIVGEYGLSFSFIEKDPTVLVLKSPNTDIDVFINKLNSDARLDDYNFSQLGECNNS